MLYAKVRTIMFVVIGIDVCGRCRGVQALPW
jgi:Zn-finger nucleic acid-binding protein